MANYKALTTEQMLASGWSRAETKHPGESSRCRSCKAEIEWFVSKNGKHVPFDVVDPGDTAAARVSHFATCPNADEHRSKSTTAKPAPAKSDRDAEAAAIRAQYQRFCDVTTGPHDKVDWLFNRLIDARLEVAVLRRQV